MRSQLKPSPKQKKLEAAKRPVDTNSIPKSKPRYTIYKDRNGKLSASNNLGHTPYWGRDQAVLSALYKAQQTKNELKKCQEIIDCVFESKRNKANAREKLSVLKLEVKSTREAAKAEVDKYFLNAKKSSKSISPKI